MFVGVGALVLAALAIWKFPIFAASSTPTLPPATATIAAPTSTSPQTVSAAQAPTETVVPTVQVNIGVGGADKIALTANDDIYIMDMDGSNIKQLINTNKPKFDLQWLPGGTELLYGEVNCVYKIDFPRSAREYPTGSATRSTLKIFWKLSESLASHYLIDLHFWHG